MYIKTKLSGVDDAMWRFYPKKVAIAARGALNRSIRSGKTAASDLIRADGGRGLCINLRTTRKGSKGKEILIAKKEYTEVSMFNKPVVMKGTIAKVQDQWQKEWANQIKQLQNGQGFIEQ